MFSKTPVITNKYGVFKEAAGPDAFYLEDVKNPDEIREKIQEIYWQYPTAQIDKSYRYAIANFSDEVIARQYHQLYQSLIDEAK